MVQQDHPPVHGTGTGNAVSGIIRRPVRSLFLYVLIIAGAGYLYLTLPTSFLPEEDQGNFMAMLPCLPGPCRRKPAPGCGRWRTT